MKIDSQGNFPRARNGYDPQYVDAILEDQNREIADLKQQKTVFSNTLAEYKGKIELLSESTRKLEEERARESLRVTGMMNAAARMAEETEQKAKDLAQEIVSQARQDVARICQQAQTDLAAVRQDAARICRQAQTDLATARQAMKQLSQAAQTMQQRNEQYMTDTSARLTELVTFLNKAANGIPAEPLSFATNTPSPSNDNKNDPLIEEGSESIDHDIYTDFLKKMGLE